MSMIISLHVSVIYGHDAFGHSGGDPFSTFVPSTHLRVHITVHDPHAPKHTETESMCLHTCVLCYIHACVIHVVVVLLLLLYNHVVETSSMLLLLCVVGGYCSQQQM